MSQTPVISDQRRDQVLADALNRQTQILLTHRTPEGWRVYKSTILAGSKDAGRLTVAAPVPRQEAGTWMPPMGETLGVTFRIGHKKCMFHTVRVASPDADPQRVDLRWPDQLHQMQRRVYQRVAPPKGTVVAVKFWHLSACPNDRQAKRDVRYGELENLSAGGLRVNAANAAGLELEQSFECLLTPRPGTAPIIAEVTLRHREAAEEGRASLGFQFIGLEATAEGQEVLTHIAEVVTDYQRSQRRAER